MGIFDFGGLSTDELAELAGLANASYAGQSPPAGWTTLTGTDLGFVEGFLTGTYDGDTFVGSAGFLGAPAAQVYLKGSELTVSFRGTDTSALSAQLADFATYLDIIGNNNYINAFNSLLDAVQGYAEANLISDINVVGHSLGAAATNILRNVSATKNDGFFDSATYFTIATPKVSSNPNIFNVGFENDWVFEAISRSTPFVSSDFFSATDNLILYDDEYAEDGWPGFIFGPSDVSAHSSTGYIEAIQRVAASSFYSDMVRDSVVLVVDTDQQVTDKDTSTSDHFGQSAFYVGRSVADDILGGQAADFIDGGAGDDTLQGAGGDDRIDGAEGTDVAVLLGDCLEYDISRATDGSIVVNHVRGDMQDSMDTLTNVEVVRFADGKELDLTVSEIHGCTELGFVQDFVTGTTQDTQVVFDLARLGDTSYDVEVFVDGRVTTGNANFNDFYYTIPAGENPQLIITASVSEAFGDVAFDFEISIDVVSPLEQLVMFSDSTAGGVLIGDEVDDQGGWFWGDPHLISFDNVAYDFQAEGEFVLARATTGAEYELQARFRALSSAVSVADAMATRVGTSVVSVEIDGADGLVRIDGVETALADGESVGVGSGAISRDGRTILIDHGNGDQTEATVYAGFLNATPIPASTRDAGGFEGLLGNDNGTPADDFQLADGTVLLTPVPVETLYGEFADSWIVAAVDRMLPGEATAYDAPDRIVTVDSLPATLRAEAEAVVDGFGISNELVREAAILDFALTGNTDFIEAAVLTDEYFDPIVGTVAVDPVVNPVVVLTADSTTLIEEDTEAQVATLTVSRGSTEGDLTVHYALAGSGASPASDQDFVGASIAGSVVIEDGKESTTFKVEVVDDSIDEGLEAFDVSISLDPLQAEDYELLVSSVRLTIEDNDTAPPLNEVRGTEGGDYLTGTSGNDAIFSLGGSYDRSAGGDGADEFVFGQETRNGIRERDVILDYEVGIDSIVLTDGASIGAVRQSSGGVVIFLEGDNDAIYVRGDGVTDDNLSIFTEAEFDFG